MISQATAVGAVERLDVAREVQCDFGLGRVAPADDEDLVPLRDQGLDDGAAGREVQM